MPAHGILLVEPSWVSGQLWERPMERNELSLDADPRWRRLHDRTWTCPECGVPHGGLFDLASGKPDSWEGNDQDKALNATAATSRHFLSEDFCVRNGEDHFVRCVLEIPVVGGGGKLFAYGVWSSLSAKNFSTYVETFDSGEQGSLGPWFSWFSNRLKGYPDTLNLKCQVHPRNGRQRPWVELEPTDHPLAVEQRDGVTLDRILEIYAFNGHDFRRLLVD